MAGSIVWANTGVGDLRLKSSLLPSRPLTVDTSSCSSGEGSSTSATMGNCCRGPLLGRSNEGLALPCILNTRFSTLSSARFLPLLLSSSSASRTGTMARGPSSSSSDSSAPTRRSQALPMSSSSSTPSKTASAETSRFRRAPGSSGGTGSVQIVAKVMEARYGCERI